MLHHCGLNARLFLKSNSAYSISFCSHSLMLTEWGCDSICVGCKTGMIVELGICVFDDAIIEDYTSSSSYLKMTQHIITARLTHATLSAERMGAMKDEVIIVFFFLKHVTKLRLHMPVLSVLTMYPICLITEMKTFVTDCCYFNYAVLLYSIYFMHFTMTPQSKAQFSLQKIFGSGLCNMSV